MANPTYSQLADPAQGGPGFSPQTPLQRLLTIFAIIASGQNPDGTTAPPFNITGASLTNPTITGTVAGAATYTSPTVSSPAFTGTATGLVANGATLDSASTIGGVSGTTIAAQVYGAWTGVTYGTNMAAFGSGQLTPAVRKNGDWVECKGLLGATGTTASNPTICTLPVGFRPSAIHLAATACNAGGATVVTVQVNTDGTVVLTSSALTSGQFAALGGISFPLGAT